MNKILPGFFGRFFWFGLVFLVTRICHKLLLFIIRYFSVSNMNVILLSMLSCNVLCTVLNMKINQFHNRKSLGA